VKGRPVTHAKQTNSARCPGTHRARTQASPRGAFSVPAAPQNQPTRGGVRGCAVGYRAPAPRPPPPQPRNRSTTSLQCEVGIGLDASTNGLHLP
jgi:hypothetical protein